MRHCEEQVFRQAELRDLPQLIALLADDDLGKLREDLSLPVAECYQRAFEHIERDPDNELIVLESEQRVAGMLQLSFIPYLTHRGSWRGQVEGVRVHRDFRGRGLGRKLLAWAIRRARQRGCAIIQLTSDKRRHNAIRFYQSLGFEATHEGFKMKLENE